MNKKGVTLIEVIAIIALIALVLGILFPNANRLIKKAKNSSSTVQDSTIVESAKNYLADHIEEDVSFDETSTITITLKQLVDGGYLTKNPADPNNNKKYNLNTSTVLITKSNNDYNYTLNLNT